MQAYLLSLQIPTKIDTKHPVILDAHAGLIVITPSKKDLEQATLRRIEDKKQQNEAREKRFEPAITKENKQIKVLANVTDINTAKLAKEEGAEGIGLLRTEFLFKEKKPSFEDQVESYDKDLYTF